MKLKRKRAVEVPPKIRSFINGVLATPLENIEEPLKTFVWEFDKGDFHHWVDLFNYFESFFEKYIKPRKDLLIEDDFLEHDPPFPRETVLEILRIVRVILENCTNKHFYSSYEHHLSSLLASTDADVVESCLQTFASFLKKSLGKHTLRDTSLSSKLFAFAQGWGPKEEGLGLLSCAINNDSDSVAHELGTTLHFEFYEETDSLQIIHLPKVNTSQQSDHELMQKLVKEYKVPLKLRFSLLTRLRFARSFVSFSKREQYTCIRLRAFIALAQACGDTDDLVSFFNTEPEFVNELVTLLSHEDTVSEKVRILSLNALVALSQDRLRQPTVLTTVTCGAHRGILSSLTHKATDLVLSNSSESSSVVFAEALISLITILVSSSSGCSAMRESGFIPMLLPLLKDTNPQHLHLVSAAVHVLEAFMDYSNPATTLFRDLGGLDDTIFRLNLEVSHVENASKEQQTSDVLVSYHRKSLMKALLRSISLGTYAPGTTSRVYDSEESLLLYCLRVIFKKAKDFGGGVFSLAAIVMSDLIHKDPTCFPILEASGLPSAFLDAITDNILCSSEAIHCIPQCLDALCLNNSGLQAVKDRYALRSLVKIFTRKTYLRVLTGDLPSSLSSGLDELMRHASSLRSHGVNVLIEILNAIEKLGYGMETEDENENENSEKVPESSLPDCVNNAARLLENLLQNSDTCRLFIEMKGVEAVLKLFTLPLMPFSSMSIGPSVAIAFKNFSPHHYASLARALCSFMKEHLKLTNEELVSLEGKQLSQVEDNKRTKVLRCLCVLEGILSVLNSLSKGIPNIVSEFGASDAHVLKDLGVTFKEILWQQSMFCDSKIDESSFENANLGDDASGASNNVVDDSTDSVMRYMNAVSSARNNSHLHSNLHSQAAIEREFLSMVRNGEGFSRRNRHGLARIRGGRTWRRFDVFHMESDSSINNTDTSSSSEDVKKKTPEVLVVETLNKLSSTLQSFFTSLVRGFTLTNRRRGETASLTTASKNIANTLAKLFLEALTFSGYNTSCADLDTSLSLKCRYLGKVVDHMAVLTYDSKRGTCNAIMINNFYVQGTFKELLNTFEATSQLLWTLPCSVSTCGGVDSWLLNSLESYCHALEFFINSSLILSPSSSATSASQNHLVLQPVEVGLSIILFPVPRDPKVFVRMLQCQVLDCILPIWNHPMFASCDPRFVTKIVSLVNGVYCGVDDAKISHGGGPRGGTNNAPDEATVSTLVEMGFTRRRAEEALRRVEMNSVEMAMEWLFTHAEDPVVEEHELAQALALSLGSSSENPPKAEEKPADSESEATETNALPVDDILASMMKLVELGDSVALPLTELVTTLCTRNKGEDKTKVVSFLVQQLKLYPLEFSKETSALCTISNSLASLLTEDITTRETAVENDIVSVSISILINFIVSRSKSQNELPIPKCISTLLLVLDSLLQNEGTKTGSLPLAGGEEETNNGVEKIIGKSTGYLSIEEGERVVSIVCDMIKQRVPGMVMQAVLTVCGRLTKTHSLALRFLENGGMLALLNLPQTCMYETLSSIIIRHIIDDPHTLQTAMEVEIRKTLTTNRIAPRTFLTSMAPLISRDPEVFMKAASAVCQLESSGGRSVVVLSKEKEKEKDKPKGVEITESKPQDLQVKSKGQKKIPPNLTYVIHHLLELILNYPSTNPEECTRSSDAMEVDHDPMTSKGKSKVDETIKEPESLLEGTDKVSQVTFILKLLSDILLMYPHAAGIVLKRDLEICHGGILHHVVHRFLHPFIDKNNESREKLSEKASSFLVLLCGRSSEGRRRVIHELYKVLLSFSNSAISSSKGRLLPDKKILAFVDLLYSIMSKNSSSSNLIGCGCSPDIAKGMIGGGMIPCLSNVLGVLDLDHPDAPKVVNVILKVLEGLTRAANAAEQLSLSDKKKSVDQSVNDNTAINQTSEANRNSQHEVTVNDVQQNSHDQTAVQEMRTDLEETETETETVEGFIMHEEMEDNGAGDEEDDLADEDDDEVGNIPDDRAALMALADTDLEDHDETGLLEEFNDEMIDEEDDDPNENHVLEVRWREALYNFNNDMQLLGQPEVNDLFGGGRPLGFARRRLPNNHRTNVLRDPLLSRAIQSHEDALRSLQLLTSDIRRAGRYDAPVIPFDHVVHASGGGGPPPYVSYSGGSRWTDDGQPQAAGQASAIAEAMEQQFMSRVRTTSPSSHISASDDQVATGGGGQQNENEGQQDEIEQNMVYLQPNQEQEHGPAVDFVDDLSNGQDNMEIVEGDENVNEQEVQRDRLSATDNETNNHELVIEGDNHVPVEENADVDMNVVDPETSDNETIREVDSSSEENTRVAQDNGQTQTEQSDASNANGIDPAFLEALPEDLRAEVLASQQVRSTPGPAPAAADSSAVHEEIDPEFLAALPPDIQAEVLAQQRAQRLAQQAQGQPVDMDNASIIATFPADLRHEVLLTSSEAVISALPSPLLAEAQMLRDRAMSHYQARSLINGSNHRVNNNRRNGLGLDRRTVMDRGVGITIGHKSSSMLAQSLKVKDLEGEPLLDADALKALIKLLRLAQPLGKNLLQRLLFNLCANSSTRESIVYLLLEMIKQETEGPVGALTEINSQRLYGCLSSVVYSRSQLIDGLPPVVLRRVLETLTYLARNHSCVGDILFYFDSSSVPSYNDKRNDKGKEKVVEGEEMSNPDEQLMECDVRVPILLFIKLLNYRLFPRSIAHLEQVLGLLQVVVYTAALKVESSLVDKSTSDGLSISDDKKSVKMFDIFMKLPQTDLRHLCSLLGHEGLSDKVYTLTGDVVKKLASVAPLHRKFFIVELSDQAQRLSSSAINELITLRNSQMLSLNAGSMAGASVLRLLQTLNSLTSNETKTSENDSDQEHITMWKLNASLEPLWKELSECISVTESQLLQPSSSSVTVNANVAAEQTHSSPLPPGTQRLLPFIESFLVLCEKLHAKSLNMQQEVAYATASEVKQLTGNGSESGSSLPCGVDSTALTFTRFSEKHRRLLNAFIRQDPTLLEKSLSMLLKAPKLMDFDNKKSYFRSKIRKQHEQHLSGPLRISVRRAYILEDSYNQLRMRPMQDMKGRLNVHFQGEEGIDAGGLTREWYQVLCRVIFDKGALLFTTGGNNATFQPNPNSVYQTEHLSYFKFVGRVVAKALYDGQLLDVYFTRSFYKHILGAKVTYHDIEAVDPDYYKNLKWMLENDVSDIPDLTFSMDADEEKHILYEKTEVTDYELKPGGRNIRVTEETKHEYVDLVAEHILTNAIRPQINSFLQGFNELIPRELVSIFNDKELELLISGLPEIDFDDLKVNTEYTGYTAGSNVIMWFWEVVKAFSKEDRARLLQFVTGTSKVPLEGFKALQGISGPQRFQIHKAYGAPERLPSAHTCFNQLDLPEYMSKEQLQQRLLLAIHEASEGFGFG